MKGDCICSEIVCQEVNLQFIKNAPKVRHSLVHGVYAHFEVDDFKDGQESWQETRITPNAYKEAILVLRQQKVLTCDHDHATPDKICLNMVVEFSSFTLMVISSLATHYKAKIACSFKYKGYFRDTPIKLPL